MVPMERNENVIDFTRGEKVMLGLASIYGVTTGPVNRLKFLPDLPWAFTGHGALMLANVLNSGRAASAGVMMVRMFVKLRQMLAPKLDAMEKKHDSQIKVVIDAIRRPMSLPARPKREIGFHVKYNDDKPAVRRR